MISFEESNNPNMIENSFRQDQEAEDSKLLWWNTYKDLWPTLDLVEGQIVVKKIKVLANDKQISGTHYKQFKGMEPWDVITAWDLDYLTGSAVKYLARWKHKGGLDDVKKAIHFLEKLIEVEENKKSKLNGLFGSD